MCNGRIHSDLRSLAVIIIIIWSIPIDTQYGYIEISDHRSIDRCTCAGDSEDKIANDKTVKTSAKIVKIAIWGETIDHHSCLFALSL